MITRLTDRKGPYDTIFFDLDGTLVDSAPGIVNGLRFMFDKAGLNETNATRIRAFLGPPILRHLIDAYGFSETDAYAAYKYFRDYYDTRGILESEMFPGMEDLLQMLISAGKTLYVATSKPESLAFRMLENNGILGLFARVFGAVHDEGVYMKDDVLTRAAALTGGVPEHGVMVGDRNHDVLGARHIGLDAVGVLYGYGDFDELKAAGSDIIAERPGDLTELLMEDNR